MITRVHLSLISQVGFYLPNSVILNIRLTDFAKDRSELSKIVIKSPSKHETN